MRSLVFYILGICLAAPLLADGPQNDARNWSGGVGLGVGSLTYEQPNFASHSGGVLAVDAEAGYAFDREWSVRTAGTFLVPFSGDISIQFFDFEIGPRWWFFRGLNARFGAFLGYSFLTTLGSNVAKYGFENSSGLQARLLGQIDSGENAFDINFGFAPHATDASSLSTSNAEWQASFGYRWRKVWHDSDLTLGLDYSDLSLTFLRGNVSRHVLMIQGALRLPE